MLLKMALLINLSWPSFFNLVSLCVLNCIAHDDVIVITIVVTCSTPFSLFFSNTVHSGRFIRLGDSSISHLLHQLVKIPLHHAWWFSRYVYFACLHIESLTLHLLILNLLYIIIESFPLKYINIQFNSLLCSICN